MKSDVQPLLATAPTVSQHFNLTNSPSASPLLGLLTLSVGPSPDSASHTFSASTSISTSISDPKMDLILGLLSSASSGKGFDSLTFSVVENTTNQLQLQTFTSLASANAYFTDHPFDFGPSTALQSLQLTLTATISGNDSYTPTLLVGETSTVPEAASLVLVPIACASP